MFDILSPTCEINQDYTGTGYHRKLWCGKVKVVFFCAYLFFITFVDSSIDYKKNLL